MCEVHQKVKHRIIIWPETSLLDIYPTEWKAGIHTNICKRMFMAGTLFIIAKKWKQPKCLINGWMKKSNAVYPQNRILSSHRRNEVW